mgnify:CR=1 FL=1
MRRWQSILWQMAKIQRIKCWRPLTATARKEQGEIERMILDKIKVKDSFIVETGGISTMYANDGGIIVVL